MPYCINYFLKSNKKLKYVRSVLLLSSPDYSLQNSRNNFHYKAATIWNQLIPNILEKPELDEITSLVIPGSCKNLDLTANIGFVRNKAKSMRG